MAEKVTVMVLEVDLQCPCCYKKVKKILCKFPHIRDQVYNEKANTVTITVVCCSPEKIRDQLCCKGYKVIKSIEIKEPPEPKPKPKPKSNPEEKPPQEKKKDPKPNPELPPATPPAHPPALPPPKTRPGIFTIDGCPPNYPVPVRTCCRPCYEGYGGGPCYHGYGVPPPPQPCHCGYYGYGYNQRGCYVNRCDYSFCEENPQACSIM